MPRIRVLRVITWLPVGGIERRLVALLPRLDRDRFDLRVACLRERGPLADELEAAGIPVDLVPFRTRWDPAALRRLAALMRERRIEIVHSHMYRANVPATVAARLAGVPVVWGQVHNVGTWETRRQALMDRLLSGWRTGMIAVSGRVRDDVVRTLRLPPERVRVIYNGVDIDRFAAARARRDTIRAREGAAPADAVFLFAARLVEQKRCADFLDALARLQSAPAAGAPPLHAWILGDGPLRPDIEARVRALPDPTAAGLLGRRDDVEEFMAAADAFVLPSTREGFSNALIEALAAGLPAIATDVGGNAEAVRDGIDGFILPPLNPGRLAAAIETLWRDAPLRNRLATSAAARARDFSLDAMARAVEQLYAESIAGAPPRA